MNFVKQDLQNKKQIFEIFMKRGLKEGISIDADSGPLGYVLWCCGSRSWEVFTFYQIGFGHTVLFISPNFNCKLFQIALPNNQSQLVLNWNYLDIFFQVLVVIFQAYSLDGGENKGMGWRHLALFLAKIEHIP